MSLAFITACTSKDQRSELEKQEEFEGHFEPGMSRYEVEHKLSEIGVTELLVRESNFDNGDISIGYRTSYSEWGASSYYFRFTPNDKLIVVYPLWLGS